MKRKLSTKTKILATLGPSSSSVSALINLIKAGVNGFRINFSHGVLEERIKLYNNIKEAEKKSGKRVFIVQDLCGPKIRLGILENPVFLHKDQEFFVENKDKITNKETLPLPLGRDFSLIKSGEHFFINDGIVEVIVKKRINKDKFIIKVIKGGVVSSHKGVNFPSQEFSFSALTKKDKKDVEFNIKYPVDYIALSFVRHEKDILELKKILKKHSLDIPIISKVEKIGAIERIDKIIEYSDAIMVARGDLAVEAGFSSIGILQKEIIKKTINGEKPVIVATQMLESMIENSVPTRAEITDITNAVLDGADTLMLSAETAVGKNPTLVIKTMKRIISKAEEFYSPKHNSKKDFEDIYGVVSDMAVEASDLLKTKLIVTPTMSGTTAKKIASRRPNCFIYALTTNEKISKQLLLYRAVFSDILPLYSNTDEMINMVEEKLRNIKGFKKNDCYVLTAGIPTGKKGSTNLIRIEKL
jgi:pyruvate kinase